MKYFVTGATGFVGSHVVSQLVDAGHQVVAVVRDPAKASELASRGVELHQGDVTYKDSMRPPMRGVDGVFHIAGWYKIGARDRSDAETVNVQGTRNVLELMQELGVPKGVYTSSLVVNSDTHGKVADESYRYEGPHLSEYDRTKWSAHYDVAEPMIKEGLPLVIVQPGVIYGPGDTSIFRTTLVRYLQRKLPILPPDSLTYCWGYIDDIAHAHLLAMEKGKAGESYIIAGPCHTVAELLQMAQNITGVPGPRMKASPGMLRGMAGIMGVVEKFMAVPYDFSAEYLRTSAGVTALGSNEKARRELGYGPRPLEQGLAETLQYEMRLLGMKAPSRR